MTSRDKKRQSGMIKCRAVSPAGSSSTSGVWRYSIISFVILSAVLFFLIASAVGADAPQTVAGKVFLDANANGKLDEGEKPVSSVRITDGVNFATAGPDGSYRIELADDPTFAHAPSRTVSVCWPTNTWPTGKWWVRLSEVADPTAVHFGLRADKQSLPLMYMHTTDDHGDFVRYYKLSRPFIDGLHEVKFVVNTGDTGRPDKMAAAEKTYKTPFFHAIGNHDLYEADKTPDKYWYGNYTRSLGPVRWSFDCAGIHFVGIDCFEDSNRASQAAKWLAKDLAALPKGARIMLFYHYPNPTSCASLRKVIRDYRVELIHAGHNHTYGYWDRWDAPMYTAYTYRAGNIHPVIVDDRGIHYAMYCNGCKPGKSYAHSRRCPVRHLEHVLLANINGRFGTAYAQKNLSLEGDGKAVVVSTRDALVHLVVKPAPGGAAGVRIGAGETTCDVIWRRERLIVNGVSFPFSCKAGKSLDLTIFVQKNMLTVWADNRFFMEAPVKLDRTRRVQPFAEDAKAAVTTWSVREVKFDPSNRNKSYFCPCSHGAIRRTAQ